MVGKSRRGDKGYTGDNGGGKYGKFHHKCPLTIHRPQTKKNPAEAEQVVAIMSALPPKAGIGTGLRKCSAKARVASPFPGPGSSAEQIEDVFRQPLAFLEQRLVNWPIGLPVSFRDVDGFPAALQVEEELLNPRRKIAAHAGFGDDGLTFGNDLTAILTDLSLQPGMEIVGAHFRPPACRPRIERTIKRLMRLLT